MEILASFYFYYFFLWGLWCLYASYMLWTDTWVIGMDSFSSPSMSLREWQALGHDINLSSLWRIRPTVLTSAVLYILLPKNPLSIIFPNKTPRFLINLINLIKIFVLLSLESICWKPTIFLFKFISWTNQRILFLQERKIPWNNSNIFLTSLAPLIPNLHKPCDSTVTIHGPSSSLLNPCIIFPPCLGSVYPPRFPHSAALFSKTQSHWCYFVSNYHYWFLAAPWWGVSATVLQAFVPHHAACLFPRLLTLAMEPWPMRARVLHSSVSLLFWPGDKKQQRVATFHDLECRTYSRHLILIV